MSIKKLAKILAAFYEENPELDESEMEAALVPLLQRELTTYLPRKKQSTPSPSEKRLEYAVIEHPNPEALSVHVNSLLNIGWKPQGGLAVTTANDYYYYCQALVREVISGNQTA